MNLLQSLSQQSHPLHNAVSVVDDKNIRSGFDGREMVIYGEDRNCLEMLAREIIFATMLFEEKKFYQIEHALENNKRIDAIAEPDGQGIATNIIEFKNVSVTSINSMNDLNQVFDVAKSQVLNFYLDNNKVRDCFVSIIITDVEKIVNNPENYGLYFDTDEEKKASVYNSLKKYGICIKTFRYNKIRGQLEDMHSNYVCSHAIFQITSLNASKKPTLLPNCLTTVTACKVVNAVSIPTKGQNSVGVKNVRDIKSIEDPEKKKLVHGFMNDLLLEFIEDSTNYFAFFNKGKTKDFTYVLPKTIVFNNDKQNGFIVATLDGALIDGQNSVNSFKIILDMISKKMSAPETMSKPERSLYARFEKMYAMINPINTMTLNENILSKFKVFVENQMIKFEILEVATKESAIDYAIAKNNSIPVSKSELCHSKIADNIQLLGYQLSEAGIDLEFPKKNRPFNMSLDVDKISFEKVIKLLHATLMYKDQKTNNIFHTSYKLNSGFNIGEFEKVKRSYLEKELNLTSEQYKEVNQIDEEIRDLNKAIETAERSIEEAEDEHRCGELTTIGRNKRITRYTSEIDESKERIKALNSSREAYVSFAFKDISTIKNTVKFYLSLCKIAKESQTEADKTLISQYFNYENYWFDVVYVHIMRTHKKPNSLNAQTVASIYRKLTDNFQSLSDNYSFGTTMIRNGNCALIPSKNAEQPNIGIDKFLSILTNVK